MSRFRTFCICILVIINGSFVWHSREKVDSLKSAILSPKIKMDHEIEKFSSVQSLVLFIGYPRSGHSLFASLMDAHPNMVISHEYNLLERYFDPIKATRITIFEALLKRSNAQTKSGWRSATTKTFFDYSVPGLWQGTSNGTILAIGDKKGGGTSINFFARRMERNFKNILDIVNLPVKFIHVIRNPFDNIATIILRAIGLRQRKLKNINREMITPTAINKGIRYYFTLAKNNVKIREQFPGQYLDIYYTDVRLDTQKTLATMCNFIQVPCDKDYIEKAAGIVRKNSTLTRQYIPWSKEQKEMIENEINSISFLKGFKFDI